LFQIWAKNKKNSPQVRAILQTAQQVIINAQITIILADRSIIGCAENPSIDV
jgi:hypothetical protein